MLIVCGTDLSQPAAAAARVAARLAARRRATLLLVHAVDDLGAEHGIPAGEPQYEPIRERLAAAAAELRQFDIAVEPVLHGQAAARTLVHLARERDAALIVIAPVGEGGFSRKILGSTAAGVVSRSPVPVLAVREEEPFTAWLAGERPLRVVVGADDSPPGEAALAWVGELREVGRCDVTLVRIADPAAEHRRLGLAAPAAGLSNEARSALERDLAERVDRLGGAGEVRAAVRESDASPDDELAQLVNEVPTDLLVVGTNQWSGFERLRKGSVSRAVVRSAATSVACVPASAADPAGRVPAVDTVLAATDLTDADVRVVPQALALVPDGGTLHVVHVADHADGRLHPALRRAVPSDAEARGVHVRVHVLTGADAAETICAAAERVDADVICIGSPERSGIARALTGSTVRSVVERTRRPVLLVRR